MRLRYLKTIYLIKEVCANDIGIEFTTFDNKKLYHPVAADQAAITAQYRKMYIERKMNQLTLSGYLEVFALEERN